MSDLLAALPVVKRNQYFIPATECLVRICKAFPPLREEVTSLLLKLGKISLSQMKKSSGVGMCYLKFCFTISSDFKISALLKKLL